MKRKLCIDGSIALTGQIRFFNRCPRAALADELALGWYPLPFQGKESASQRKRQSIRPFTRGFIHHIQKVTACMSISIKLWVIVGCGVVSSELLPFDRRGVYPALRSPVHHSDLAGRVSPRRLA